MIDTMLRLYKNKTRCYDWAISVGYSDKIATQFATILYDEQIKFNLKQMVGGCYGTGY